MREWLSLFGNRFPRNMEDDNEREEILIPLYHNPKPIVKAQGLSNQTFLFARTSPQITKLKTQSPSFSSFPSADFVRCSNALINHAKFQACIASTANFLQYPNSIIQVTRDEKDKVDIEKEPRISPFGIIFEIITSTEFDLTLFGVKLLKLANPARDATTGCRLVEFPFRDQNGSPSSFVSNSESQYYNKLVWYKAKEISLDRIILIPNIARRQDEAEVQIPTFCRVCPISV